MISPSLPAAGFTSLVYLRNVLLYSVRFAALLHNKSLPGTIITKRDEDVGCLSGLTCLLACWGAENREISESAPRVLSKVLSEIGVLLGVLPRVLSRVLFLLFCTERAPS